MIVIAIAAIAFLAGVIAGVMVLVRAGISREESDRSLIDEPPTIAAKATRRLVGLYVRTPHNAAGSHDAQGHRAETAERRWPPSLTAIQ